MSSSWTRRSPGRRLPCARLSCSVCCSFRRSRASDTCNGWTWRRSRRSALAESARGLSWDARRPAAQCLPPESRKPPRVVRSIPLGEELPHHGGELVVFRRKQDVTGPTEGAHLAPRIRALPCKPDESPSILVTDLAFRHRDPEGGRARARGRGRARDGGPLGRRKR